MEKKTRIMRSNRGSDYSLALSPAQFHVTVDLDDPLHTNFFSFFTSYFNGHELPFEPGLRPGSDRFVLPVPVGGGQWHSRHLDWYTYLDI